MTRKSALGSVPQFDEMDFDLEAEKRENGITDDTPVARRGRPRNENLIRKKGVKNGLEEGWSRATFIVRDETMARLTNYAAENRISKKEALDEILSAVLRNKKATLLTADEKEKAKQERLEELGLSE